MIDSSYGDGVTESSDPPRAGLTSRADARFLQDVAELVDIQVASGGGYVEDGDPETLPTVVFWPGWPR